MSIYKKLIIGLTGGIGSGKSKVCELFARHGIAVFNADEIAFNLTKLNTPSYHKIVEHFGSSILRHDQNVDRAQLKKIIFENAEEKKWLENLLHPAIWETLQTKVKTAVSPYVILEIPLLVEVNSHPMIDRILVIDIDPKIQMERLIKRDHYTENDAKKIMQQQATREQRLAFADDVIKNDGNVAHLAEQVEMLHQQYLNLQRDL